MQLKYFKIVRDIWQQITSNCREQLPTYDHFKVVKVRALNISLAEIVKFTLDRYPIPVHQLHIWKHSTKLSPELLSIYISVASECGTMCWRECVFFRCQLCVTLEGFAVLCCFMFTVCFTFTTTRLHDSAQLDPRGLQLVEIAGFQSAFTVSRFYLWDRFARPKIDESLKKRQ